jgi:predicted phosphate transport protein (TIGR00153 family)
MSKLPFFGLLAHRCPMEGLVEHYDKIAECIHVIGESLECYVSGVGACREFTELTREIDAIEDHADSIKRNIRNHLPRRLFMAVDKTLFLNYTKSQDNILDSAQEALQWLGMRQVAIPEGTFQKMLIDLLEEVRETTELLGPALRDTIGFVHGETVDRSAMKVKYQAVRRQHHDAQKLSRKLTEAIYNSSMDFKDIYQLIHFVDCLVDMSHNSENCADILRTMIAR